MWGPDHRKNSLSAVVLSQHESCVGRMSSLWKASITVKVEAQIRASAASFPSAGPVKAFLFGAKLTGLSLTNLS